MKYAQVVFGTFVSRPNRFEAFVQIEGEDGESAEPALVHVKNTGRCKELLIPGCRVVLSCAQNPKRKTAYDLIAVYKPGTQSEERPEGWLFNIDSQAPNHVAAEWLANQGYSLVKPEFAYGESRVDFMMERAGATPEAAPERFLMEVKGCTLEREGIGYFPDAPTERGIKHLKELAGAVAQGWHAALLFVVPMEGVTRVFPNVDIHPAFGEALAEARAAGVEVYSLPCRVTPNTLEPWDPTGPAIRL